MAFLRDFKDFAMRGNVMDMAVGVIIGGAFGKIVSSLVTDIIMPPIGLIVGRIDFDNMFFNLTDTPAATVAAARAANIPIVTYGIFINNIVNFVIQAFVIFVIVREMNRMRPAPPAPLPQKECPFCLSLIDERATRCPNCTSEIRA